MISDILSKRFIQFCIVGLSGVIVNEGLLWTLTEFAGVFYIFSSIIAIEISIIANFMLNDVWTFKDKREQGTKKYFTRLGKWNLARILTSIINIAILWALTSFGMHYLISNLIGIFLATLLAYGMSLSWVWSKK